MRDIGKNIRELRISSGMTQDVLADKLFVTRQTVSNYETGKSRPDIDMLVAMAELFDCDINSVLYGLPLKHGKADTKHFWHGFAGCIVVGVFILIIKHYAEIMSNRFIYAPAISNKLVFVPVFMIFLGWTFAQGILLLLKANKPAVKYGKYIYYALIALGIVYFTLCLPMLFHCIKTVILEAYVHEISAPIGLSISFKLKSELINRASGLIYLYVLNKPWLFFAAGVFLCIFESTKSASFKRGIVLLMLILVLSGILYLSAESSFTVEVEDKSILENFPLNIEIVEKQEA